MENGVNGIGLKMMRVIGRGLFDKNSADVIFSEEELAHIYYFAEKFDVTDMVAYSLQKMNMLSEKPIHIKYQDKIAKTFSRFARMERTEKQVFDAFESAGIDYIPLKGAVIRYFYEEPSVRTSCDLDILVRKEDLDRAVATIERIEGYKKCNHWTLHDIKFVSANGINVELHHEIIEKTNTVLGRPWDFAKNTAGSRWDFTNEFFYCYFIAHGKKHFISGGCGLKIFADLISIRQKMQFDEIILDDMLSQCGILEFSKQILLLADALFEGRELNQLQSEMISYIFKGECYGDLENYRQSFQASGGNKLQYVLRKIWLPEERIKVRFPNYNGNKLLLPYYQALRFAQRLKNGGAMDRIKDLEGALTEKKSNVEKVKKMLVRLGLNNE